MRRLAGREGCGGNAIATDPRENANSDTARPDPHADPELAPVEALVEAVADAQKADGPAGRTERTAAQVELSGRKELKAIMRIRPFRRLWVVLGIASLGDWLGLLATSIFAAAQVDNTAAKGAAFGGVIAVRLLPALILGPIAGVLADRFDRRYTMVICDVIRFVFLLSIPMATLVTDSGATVIAWTAIATFMVEALTLIWLPAKDAAVPNLIPRARLEAANQLTLATTYGITPVAGALVLAGMDKGIGALQRATDQAVLDPTQFALYFLAFTRLVTALVVLFGIKEISGRNGRTIRDGEPKPGMFREFIDGWAYLGKTPLVRGLVLGILAAFSGGGMVVGTAQFYAMSLNGGPSTFYVLFAMLFVGLAGGIVAGPRLIGALSRRRWFGLSIVLAGASVGLLAFAWHLSIAVVVTLLVGVGAGMAFLSGTTLLGGEVEDEMRGRVFAFVQTSTRVVLMLAIALSSVLVGVGGSREISTGLLDVPISTTRLLLLGAGIVGVFAGVAAFRQMDDKRGVPVIADLISSLRGRPLSPAEPAHPTGAFIVFEGGEGAGKTTQVERLAETLRGDGRRVTVTREPGATDVGKHIRSLVLERNSATGVGPLLSPRAEALLYAADRAHHVAAVVRPALARGEVVISDRYVDSSLAYQGAGRTLPVEQISWLSAWATGGLKPDLVVLLDVDPQIGLGRVAGRGLADRLEAESVPFHERVRYAFLDLAHADPGRYLVLDATMPEAEIAAVVERRVRELLPSPPDEPAAEAGAPTARPVEVPQPPPLAEDEGQSASANGRRRKPPPGPAGLGDQPISNVDSPV